MIVAGRGEHTVGIGGGRAPAHGRVCVPRQLLQHRPHGQHSHLPRGMSIIPKGIRVAEADTLLLQVAQRAAPLRMIADEDTSVQVCDRCYGGHC